MSPENLVMECRKSGVTIKLAGDALTLNGEPGAVRTAADLVRPFKAGLVQYLGHLASSGPPPAADAQPTLEGELDQVSSTAPADHTTNARLALFKDRGLNQGDAIVLVRRLALRDQQHDDRRVCLECAHLSGTVKARRCGQWRKTGMQGPPTPADLVDLPQRCAGFAHALKQMAPSGVPRSS